MRIMYCRVMYCLLAFFIWLLFKGSKSFLFRIYVLTKLCTPCIVCWYFFPHPTVLFCSKDIIAHSEYIIKSSQNHRYYLDIWSRTCCIVLCVWINFAGPILNSSTMSNSCRKTVLVHLVGSHGQLSGWNLITVTSRYASFATYHILQI